MTPARARLRVQLILQDGKAACCGRPIPYHHDPDPDFSGPTNYLVTRSGELICGSACPSSHTGREAA